MIRTLSILPAFLKLSLCSILMILLSCSKTEDGGSNIDASFVYYDYYSLAPNYINPANDTIETYRICYDMGNKQIRWQKKNEYPIPYHYSNINGYSDLLLYSKCFSIPNYLIKIFPSTVAGLLGKPMTGIYFQKIDKTTGNPVISSRIIGPAEFDINNVYSISEVVSDGDKYYFACNNGFIYCFDANGSLVWKKGNYPLGNSWINYGGYAFIYLNEKRLYFSAFDNSGNFPPGTKLLNCLNAVDGERIWQNFGADFIYGKQIAFGKNHLAIFDNYGTSSIMRKADGFEIAVNAGSGSGNSLIIPIGMTDSTHLVYFNRGGDIGFIDTDHPGDTRYIDISEVIDQNFIHYKNRIYNITAGTPFSALSLACIDPNSGVVWSKTVNIVFSPVCHCFFYNYLIKDDKLYVLSSYRFENNNFIGNPINQNRIELSISVLDLNSGSVLSQSTGLPAGLTNLNRIYNMIVE